ncbi:MAG TPA: RIP metalloprotease RseP [Parafilimonas sp.]|nr:RIP metalloprotease RseP [Parafilimonas sp.]
MTLLAIDWAGVGVKALQLILSLSILVTLHELGHYATAKWFKCRVEKFYLFFDPWFSIWKKKIGETIYGIGWVPFGGYVKISGMIDESMDKEQLKQPPKSYEFRSKPAWQRLIIMVAGVIMNILLALFLFIMITYKWGDDYLPPQNLQYGLYADSLGRKIGLENGDNIIAIGNKPVKNVLTIPADIMTSEAKTLQVKRNGNIVNLNIPETLLSDLTHTKLTGFIDVQYPIIVDTVLTSDTHFIKGSLLKGDRIISLNNHPVQFYQQFDSLKKLNANKVVAIQVLRGNDTITVNAKLNDKSQVGFWQVFPDKLFGTVHKSYTFTESIPVGIHKCFSTLKKYITGLQQIVSGKVKASESLGSVISIGNAFSAVWDWQHFWTLTAIFSIVLAFMNILPIPALDGGHALFCIYEIITGRKPTDKFMEYAQMVGMILLLGLMAYALGLDIFRLFK